MNYSKSAWIIIVFWILAGRTNYSFGQTLNFEQLTTADGLPSLECYKVVQDHKGYIWVFSEFGIVKHNGQRFVPVCTNLELKDRNAYAVFETENGQLYFSNSVNKIFYVRNDSAFSIKAIESFTELCTGPEDLIFQIAVDDSNNVYFANYNASYCYRALTGNIEVLALPETKEDDHEVRFRAIGRHLFPLRSMVSIYQQYSGLIIEKTGAIFRKKINCTGFYEPMQTEELNNGFAFMCNNGLYQFLPNDSSRFAEIKNTLRIHIDQQNNLWAGTSKGLVRLDSNFNTLGRYLNDKIISDILVDNNHGVWVTTVGDGVFHSKNKYETSYSNTTLRKKKILSLINKDSSIYITTLNGSCYELKNDTFQLLYDFNTNIFCYDIAAYQDGHLFITNKGIFHKNKNGNLGELKLPNERSLYSNMVSIQGKNEFITFGGTSINHFKNDSHTAICHIRDKIYSVIPYENGRYLVGTKNGLYEYDYVTSSTKLYSEFFSNKFIRKLNYDPEGNIWIATQNEGIYIIKNKQLIHYGSLPNVMVQDIDFFNDKGLVLTTNMGVYINSYGQRPGENSWFNIFEGEVIAVEVQRNTLWIASGAGIHSIALPGIEENNSYPIYISSVYAGPEQLPENFRKLSHDQNDLTFNIDFLNYHSGSDDFFFKLEGPTALSGPVNGTSLQINNLDPGAYRLRIFPFNGINYDMQKVVTRSFIIQPAFWQTKWFTVSIYLLIVLIPLLLSGIYYRKKITRGRKHNEINNLLAEYKLIALKAQINPHFISNSLSAIQLLIDSKQVNSANQYVAKFGLLMRYVLTFSDKHVVKLRDEIKLINLIVELEQLRFINKFNYHCHISDNTDTNEIYIPPLLSQPLIENAIWHGLIPLKGKRPPALKISIEEKNGFLIISIQDNGVGRKKRSENMIPGETENRVSKGTSIIQSRIQNLNQLYGMNIAELNIIDLYDEFQQPAGTKAELKLPVSLINKLEEHQYEIYSDRR